MAAKKTDKGRLRDSRGEIDFKHPEDYKPWLYAREFTRCRGRRTIIKDLRTDRLMHLFSGIELNYYKMLLWTPDVINIFEQYPLEYEMTLKIAQGLGVKHPRDPKTKEDIVMTTDFLYEVRNEQKRDLHAVSIKQYDFVSKKRTEEKLRIEQRYWEENNIPFQIITEKDINYELLKTIREINIRCDTYEMLQTFWQRCMDNRILIQGS